MDISFYVLLTVACLVLVLAMWACAASNTPKWGPDLTLELPPHLLQQALFGTPAPASSTPKKLDFKISTPSCPSEKPWKPLLSNEHPIAMNSPPPRYYHTPALMNNSSTAVQVLPTNCVPKHKVRPVFSTFTTEEPA